MPAGLYSSSLSLVFMSWQIAVRDTLAEVRGCVRVVVRVRPLLPVDFREGTPSRIALTWLLQAAASRLRGGPSGAAMACLVRALGWRQEASSLLRMLNIPAAAGPSTGALSTGLEADVAPAALFAGSTADGSKQHLLIPPGMTGTQFEALVASAAAVGGGSSGGSAGSALAAHLASCLAATAAADGWQFSFDRVFPPSATQHEVFDGA
ncbi:MAG: hypothetical protein EOO41_01985, partial [Methanobacteriota archaeon]